MGKKESKKPSLLDDYAEVVRKERAKIFRFEADNVERLLLGLEPLTWEQFNALESED